VDATFVVAAQLKHAVPEVQVKQLPVPVLHKVHLTVWDTAALKEPAAHAVAQVPRAVNYFGEVQAVHSLIFWEQVVQSVPHVAKVAVHN